MGMTGKRGIGLLHANYLSDKCASSLAPKSDGGGKTLSLFAWPGSPCANIYSANGDDTQAFDLLLGDLVSTIGSGTDAPDTCQGGLYPTACMVTGTWALVGSIPEPSSLGLLASDVLGLALLRRHRTMWRCG
jgi:hypothetical protein